MAGRPRRGRPRALGAGIVAAGGEVRWSTPALRVEEDVDGITVQTDVGAVRAETVVVTAGAWTNTLVGGIPLPPLVVTEESPAHFAPREVSDVWPSFNHFLTPGVWPPTCTACRRPARA